MKIVSLGPPIGGGVVDKSAPLILSRLEIVSGSLLGFLVMSCLKLELMTRLNFVRQSVNRHGRAQHADGRGQTCILSVAKLSRGRQC